MCGSCAASVVIELQNNSNDGTVVPPANGLIFFLFNNIKWGTLLCYAYLLLAIICALQLCIFHVIKIIGTFISDKFVTCVTKIKACHHHRRRGKYTNAALEVMAEVCTNQTRIAHVATGTTNNFVTVAGLTAGFILDVQHSFGVVTPTTCQLLRGISFARQDGWGNSCIVVIVAQHINFTTLPLDGRSQRVCSRRQRHYLSYWSFVWWNYRLNTSDPRSW